MQWRVPSPLCSGHRGAFPADRCTRQRGDQREQRSWWQRLVSYGNMSGAWFLAARSLRHYI